MAYYLNFLAPVGALFGGAWGQTGVETNLTTFMYPDSNATAADSYIVHGSRVAPKGADILTVGVIGGPTIPIPKQKQRTLILDIRLWMGRLGTLPTRFLSASSPTSPVSQRGTFTEDNPSEILQSSMRSILDDDRLYSNVEPDCSQRSGQRL